MLYIKSTAFLALSSCNAALKSAGSSVLPAPRVSSEDTYSVVQGSSLEEPSRRSHRNARGRTLKSGWWTDLKMRVRVC